MKKALKLLTVFAVVLAMSVTLTGCGAKSKASKLLKRAEEVTDFEKISNKDEFVENYEAFVDAGVEFYELQSENPNNEDLQEISGEFFELFNEWKANFGSGFESLDGEGGALATMDAKEKFYELSREFLGASVEALEAKKEN